MQWLLILTVLPVFPVEVVLVTVTIGGLWWFCQKLE